MSFADSARCITLGQATTKSMSFADSASCITLGQATTKPAEEIGKRRPRTYRMDSKHHRDLTLKGRSEARASPGGRFVDWPVATPCGLWVCFILSKGLLSLQDDTIATRDFVICSSTFSTIRITIQYANEDRDMLNVYEGFNTDGVEAIISLKSLTDSYTSVTKHRFRAGWRWLGP